MEILTLLYQLLIMPLQIIFEIIYCLAFKLTGNLGISIITLSFLVSLLLVPLYNRADAIQKEERDIEEKLAKGVEHIKKTFRGDEQLMMLQTYYRKNNYSPLYFLRGSLSLFLQIPFFIAAYQFLSNLDLLKGVSFWVIKDLAAPDALLNIGGMAINVLPIIMTIVNLVSTFFFTQGLSLKTKLQLNGMALFFLVFLYNSPAGLVLYWTCNNFFNLGKVVISLQKNDSPKIYVCLFLSSVIIGVLAFINVSFADFKRCCFYICVCLAMNIPFFWNKYEKYFIKNDISIGEKSRHKIFILSSIFISLLIGAFIPSIVIESSPQEFIVIGSFHNPLIYLLYSLSIALGTFVLWLGIFYAIASTRAKNIISYIVWLFCGVAIINYMFFGTKLGILTEMLQYENGMHFSSKEEIVNFVVLTIIFYIMKVAYKRFDKKIIDILVIANIAFCVLIVNNIFSIKKSINQLNITNTNIEVDGNYFSLSKNGKNVIVFMLDRGMGVYLPYLFNESEILKERFKGFTYYPNTISFGAHTIFGTPGLFGGYEYIPSEMNKRVHESMAKKHNEALKVLPVVFGKEGYNVTVCDVPYANYQNISDFSIYDEYPWIKAFSSKELLGDDASENTNNINKRNFYCFALTKCIPLVAQKLFYDNGDYLSGKNFSQEITSLYTATGTSKDFVKNYNVLDYLVKNTKINDNGKNLLVINNKITHTPCLLQLPDYVVSSNVDNTKYESENNIRFRLNGSALKMDKIKQVIHYHTNMAALLKLGEWFEFMRKNNVYDNTRIIIVSDHGHPLNHLDELISKEQGHEFDIEWYYPLLMVKDFNSDRLMRSEEFMTNADVVTLAVDKAVENPVNPFTGIMISNKMKYNDVQHVFGSHEHKIIRNSGNTYLPGRWYSVHTDMRIKDNWKVVKENAVLPY